MRNITLVISCIALAISVVTLFLFINRDQPVQNYTSAADHPYCGPHQGASGFASVTQWVDTRKLYPQRPSGPGFNWHNDHQSGAEYKPTSIVIPKGGSLCKTLRLSPDEALHVAEILGLKYYYKNGKLIVIVQPGTKIDFVPVSQ